MFSTSIPAKSVIIRLQPSAISNEAGPLAHKRWSSLKEVCELMRIAATPSIEREELRFQHRRFQRGQHVYTMGQAFECLYVVRTGSLKTVAIDHHDQEQILGFPMKGDLIGTDGIYPKFHPSEMIALSACELICLPFKQFAAVGKFHANLDSAFYSLMSEDLLREQAQIHLLGAVGAEARVAQFLVWMSKRFAQMGYSSKAFTLPMTREEIGGYLGLTLETVSRTFSGFKEMGLISVDRRAVEIKDVQALATLRRLPPSCHHKKQQAKNRAASRLGT